MTEEATRHAKDKEHILHERAVHLAQTAEEEEHGDKTQLLLVRLGDEWYALNVANVREILHQVRITRVPCAPAYVAGVVSVRGEIVSVCDLNATLGVVSEGEDQERPIVVVEVDGVTSSLLADDVSDIVEVPQNAIEPALAAIDRATAEHVCGEVMLDDRLVAILNLEHLIRLEEG